MVTQLLKPYCRQDVCVYKPRLYSPGHGRSYKIPSPPSLLQRQRLKEVRILIILSCFQGGFLFVIYLFSLGNHPQTANNGGAVLLKCKGTVINLDPVFYTWLSYQPRLSSLSQTSSKGKQVRRTSSQTRVMSAVTPRKKSYARGKCHEAWCRNNEMNYFWWRYCSNRLRAHTTLCRVTRVAVLVSA